MPFANLRKETIGFVMCVCLSVRSEQSFPPSSGRIPITFDICILLENLLNFYYDLVGITDSLREDLIKFMTISRSVLLRTRNFSDITVEKIKTYL